MCAIFGVAGNRENSVDLRRMAESMGHRGPDDEGYFSAPDHEIEMGMCRLAILDTEHGKQPVLSRCGKVAVVCNGELYNWRILRAELEADGFEFRTSCDTEILAAGWIQWGREMFTKLNGMFAIAIYDGRSGRQSLTLVRDPCGQKPLYYFQEGRTLFFSSEIRGLQAAGVPLTLNQAALREYLATRYVSQSRTMFDGIQQLGSGEMMMWSNGQVERKQWWNAPFFSDEEHERSPVNNVLELGCLVDDSVSFALQSDYPVAAYLSAGVDSNLLLDTVHRLGGDVTAFTAGFGAESDEVTVARQFAKERTIPHHEVVLSEADLSSLPKVIEQMEVPVGDALILAFDRLANATKSSGCKVALGGEGPDELFLGYSFQNVGMQAERMGGLGRGIVSTGLSLVPPALLDHISEFPAALGYSGREKLASWFGRYSYDDDWGRTVGLRTLFSSEQIDDLIGAQSDELGFRRLAEGRSLQEKHFRHQFSEWFPDWSIIRQERNTMAHSLEYRMPFLDPRLIEFSSRVPLTQKIAAGTTKWLWREFARDRIGDQSARRPKQPFYFPLERFASSPILRQLIGDHLSIERVRRKGIFTPKAVDLLKQSAFKGEFLPMKQLFSLLVFDIWHDRFIS